MKQADFASQKSEATAMLPQRRGNAHAILLTYRAPNVALNRALGPASDLAPEYAA